MIPQATPAAPALGAAAAGTAWTSGTLTTSRGVAIATFSAGRSDAGAPTVVLVHGMGHWTQAAWDAIAPYLAATHRIVAFDLPGFGDSEKPAVPYTLALFTETLGDVARGLGLERFALVGHSLGGWIAAAYAAEHPEHVRFLGLIAPAGFARTPALVLKIAGSRPIVWLIGKVRPPSGFVRKTFDSAVFDASVLRESDRDRAVALAGDPGFRRAFTSVYANSMRAFVRMDLLHARFKAYAGPALILWGREDAFIPVAGLAPARRVYPHADALVIDACGHCPNVEYPALVAERLLAAGA